MCEIQNVCNLEGSGRLRKRVRKFVFCLLNSLQFQTWMLVRKVMASMISHRIGRFQDVPGSMTGRACFPTSFSAASWQPPGSLHGVFGHGPIIFLLRVCHVVNQAGIGIMSASGGPSESKHVHFTDHVGSAASKAPKGCSPEASGSFQEA